jgi:general secretion pathway protein H
MRHGRGFTLLELLVVLVIMTLMVALVPPLLSSVGLTTEVRGAARQLSAGLRAARSEAVLRQRPVALTIDLEQRTATVDGSGKRIELPDDEDVTIRLYTAQSELVDEQRGGIRFFPDGSSTGGYIALVEGRVEYRVNVDWLTGHVRIEDRDAEN